MKSRITWLLCGAVCVVALIVTSLVLFKLDHIQFLLSRLPDIPRIPVQEFPPDAPSETSCRLTWQGFEMNVPGWSPDKSHAEVKLLNSVPWLLLSPERRKGAKGMIVIFPLDATPHRGPVLLELPPPEQEWPESRASDVAQLAEIYRAGKSDFRWSSSSSAVRRLRWLLLNAWPRRLANAERVFVTKTDAMEGILIVTDTQYIYDWRTADPKLSGEILFIGKDWKDNEQLVLSVCRSIVITAEAAQKTSLKPPLEELQKSVQVRCPKRK